jgi:mannitol-1-phosphate 5-dehydrogenase
MEDAEFAAQEDVKMWAHNGLHAFLAYLGTLRGVEYFCDLEAGVLAMASDMLRDEVGAALLRKHGAALDRNFWCNYAPTILRRIICRGLHDAVARGARDPMRKLEPWERLISGLRGIAGQGIEPVFYATGVAAAIATAASTGATPLDVRRVLTDHCKLDARKESHLIELVEARHRWLREEFAPAGARKAP